MNYVTYQVIPEVVVSVQINVRKNRKAIITPQRLYHGARVQPEAI